MSCYGALSTVEELEAHYGVPGEASMLKVAGRITPQYRRFLEASPFFTLATAGPEGLDCSPRGERGGLFRILDERTIAIPDRRGNDRIDSLRNIVRDPRIAILFLIPGSVTTIRLNGTAIVTADADLRASFEKDGKTPRTVIIVTVEEIYTQCGRAVLRAELWNAAHHVDPKSIPTAGDILKERSEGAFDSERYDREWADRAAKSMW